MDNQSSNNSCVSLQQSAGKGGGRGPGGEEEGERRNVEQRERAGVDESQIEDRGGGGGDGTRRQDMRETRQGLSPLSNGAGHPVGAAAPHPSVKPPLSGMISNADAPLADDYGGENARRKDNNRRRQLSRQHRAIRGGVKASFVGPNVEALPVWGALDAIAGSTLLLDCRTPAQWRPEEYRPTAQVGRRKCCNCGLFILKKIIVLESLMSLSKTF